MRDIDVDGDTVYPSNDSNHQAGDGSGNPTDVDHESSEKTTTTNDDLRRKILCIAVSPDGQYVATCSDDGVIRLWDLRRTSPSVGEGQSPALIERLGRSKVHMDFASEVLFSPNGRFLVAFGWDTPLRVWDLGHLGIAPTPGSLSSSSLSSREAGNGNPAEGNNWPVMGGQGKQKSRCTMQLVGLRSGGAPKAIAVSPDGRWIVCGDGRSRVMWWDLEPSSAEDSSSSQGEASTMTAAVTKRHREAVCVLNGHQTDVLSIDLSPVGDMLATGGTGGVQICEFFTSLNDLIY
jgi:glucose repression regulatory protein TUP1